MLKRRRFKHQLTLQDRLAAWARKIRIQAESLRPGSEKEILLKKADQADAAMQLENWINSPELRSPD